MGLDVIIGLAVQTLAATGSSLGKEDNKYHVLCFDEHNIIDERVYHLHSALEFIGRKKVTWILVNERISNESLEEISRFVEIDPYEAETVLEYSHGRARVEDFDGTVFVNWTTPSDGMESFPKTATLDFLLGDNFLISFHDHEGHFKEIFKRLDNKRSPLRNSAPDFLLFHVLRVLVEEYFDLAEEFSDQMERTEDRIINTSSTEIMQDIRELRGRIATFWKVVWPLRESANALYQRDLGPIKEGTRPYFKELFSRLQELEQIINNLNQIIPQLIDLIETSTSNQLNQIVKVLTVISVIFTPLTFIAGIYGMNFEHMPLLPTTWGYPFILILMATIALTMFFYFYRKGWVNLGRKNA